MKRTSIAVRINAEIIPDGLSVVSAEYEQDGKLVGRISSTCEIRDNEDFKKAVEENRVALQAIVRRSTNGS